MKQIKLQLGGKIIGCNQTIVASPWQIFYSKNVHGRGHPLDMIVKKINSMNP